MPLVRCVGVTREFRSPRTASVRAVDQVDLEVCPGEFVAIQGPSGSGKSTLLALLAGIDLPNAGTLTVLGHELARLSGAERARLRRSSIGIVFQAFGLVPALTAAENVALPLALDGVTETERGTRAEEALDDVGLAGFATARIDELSGGERQRVGVARALVTRPKLLLADEPVGSLDDESASIVLGLLEAATRQRGIGMLLVTHDPMSAARADRRLQMRDGHLRPEGTRS